MKIKLLLTVLIMSLVLVGCGDNEAADSEGKEIDYGAELQKVIDEILSNSATAESMLNTYADLWDFNIENTITENNIEDFLGISDSKAKQYFESDDSNYVSFAGNFDNIINKLKNYFVAEGKIDELQTNSEKIQSKIKELNSPTEEYEKVYDKVVELYTLTEEFTQMAISPSGSLLSFNQNRSQLSSDIVSKYKEIEVIMPENEKEEK